MKRLCGSSRSVFVRITRAVSRKGMLVRPYFCQLCLFITFHWVWMSVWAIARALSARRLWCERGVLCTVLWVSLMRMLFWDERVVKWGMVPFGRHNANTSLCSCNACSSSTPDRSDGRMWCWRALVFWAGPRCRPSGRAPNDSTSDGRGAGGGRGGILIRFHTRGRFFIHFLRLASSLCHQQSSFIDSQWCIPFCLRCHWLSGWHFHVCLSLMPPNYSLSWNVTIVELISIRFPLTLNRAPLAAFMEYQL